MTKSNMSKGNSVVVSNPYDKMKLPIKLTFNLLLSIAQLVIGRSKSITSEVLLSAYKLFNMISLQEYQKDYKSLALVCFIQSALDARINKRFTKSSMVINYIIDTNNNYKEYYEELIEEFTNEPLTPTEIEYIINELSKQLSFISIIKNKSGLQEALNKFDNGDYAKTEDIILEINRACTKMLKDIREAYMEKSETTLDTTQTNFKSNIKTALLELRASSNRLNTGVQALNKMMNGGAENKRVYTFAAPPSGGKSLLALNLALGIKKFNTGPNMVQADGSIPIVLFITHENTITETIERLYGITVSSKPIYTSEADNDYIVDKISEAIQYDPQVEGDIGIRLHYMPSYQFTVNDITTYIEELEDKGYKVIALIHDYIKKIRPNYARNDQRLDLAQVVDDFKSLALLKNIPIILLTQVSRTGFSGMEEALKRNNPDALKDSSRTIIGESWGIVENSDWVTIVLRVPVKNKGKIIGNQMSFLNTKARNGNQNTHFFFQPFHDELSLQLMCDVGGPCLAKESLMVSFEEMDKLTHEAVEEGKQVLFTDIKEGKVKLDKNDELLVKFSSSSNRPTIETPEEPVLDTTSTVSSTSVAQASEREIEEILSM